jgi:hypothetical protein
MRSFSPIFGKALYTIPYQRGISKFIFQNQSKLFVCPDSERIANEIYEADTGKVKRKAIQNCANGTTKANVGSHWPFDTP